MGAQTDSVSFSCLPFIYINKGKLCYITKEGKGYKEKCVDPKLKVGVGITDHWGEKFTTYQTNKQISFTPCSFK